MGTVDYGDAQISVPASFSVAYPGQYPCDVQSEIGTLFVGASANTACLTSPRNANTTVVYLRLQRFPSEYLHLEDSVVRNALRLYGLELNGVFGYYSPLLGAVVASAGPLAQQVINTITASPPRLCPRRRSYTEHPWVVADGHLRRSQTVGAVRMDCKPHPRGRWASETSAVRQLRSRSPRRR